jgi:predicted phage terminase large subunit-like protein
MVTAQVGADPRRDFSRLTLMQQQEIESLLRARSGETLDAFIRRVTPRFPPPRHVQPLMRLFERARRKPIRALVSMPPRHAKSETVFNGLAWWMRHSPADTHAYVTYSDDIASSQSRKIRQRAIEGGVSISREMRNLGEWRTDAGGGLFAVGVDVGLTGKGITGIAVVDDPYAGIVQASSAKIRASRWDWFTGTLMARLEHASVLVQHTRWHKDDLIGQLAKDQGWEYVNLPALAEEGDLLGRAVGEPLWPEERTLAQLLEKKAIDEFVFAALYQGQPRPRGHTVFAREPARFDLATHDPAGWRLFLSGDPAATDDTSGDFSALLALAVQGEGARQRGRVLDVFRRQITVPDFADWVIRFQDRHGGAPVGIEAVGGFKAVPQILKRVKPGIRIQEVHPVGDKFTRAQPVATAWNDGRIEVPTQAPWVSDFLAEVMAFTGISDAHDDQVDVLSQGWHMAASEIKPPTFTRPSGPILPRRR